MRALPKLQEEGDDSEDEDEETLQLRLQALEAKLKLKKIQNKKARAINSSSDAENDRTSAKAPESRTTTSFSSRLERAATPGLLRSKSTNNVQVPYSPERRPAPVQEQKSPGRVLLGIDKGLSARHVSLRRAPSSSATHTSRDDPFGGSIRPAASRAESRGAGAHSSRPDRAGLKSFNDRIAESRQHEQKEKERQDRVVKLRAQKSKGFGVQTSEIEAFKAASERESSESKQESSRQKQRGFSRDDVVRAFNKPAGGLVGGTGPTQRRETPRENGQSMTAQHRGPPPSISRSASLKERPLRPGSVSLSEDSRPSTPADSSLFESFSRTNLTRRILPHSFLERTLEDKTPTTIPALLKEIVAPNFSLPPQLEEGDFVVFGTIASKSAPLNHKETRKAVAPKPPAPTSAEEATASEANVNGKFMIFTLTDLKWTLDLYIFTTAYVRFRKLQPGTLIAILNPSIMPPPPGRTDTNRWSLTLHSSDDTILEIGTSKDLGWCKATKKDGNPCNAWVDSRKNDFCEFHVDRNIERARRGRMEVQGMSAPFAPGGKGAGRHGFFGSTRRPKNDRDGKERGLLKEGQQYDRSSHSTYFVNPHVGNHSTANLLDADEDGGGHGSREERVRRAYAQQEKERDIARKLGEGGNGTGAEYLRFRHANSTVHMEQRVTSEMTMADMHDAGALGLKNNRAGNVMLSPLKRKNSSARRGGGAGDEMEMEDPGRQRKKTRFVTAKGIREAGRESLVGTAGGMGGGDVDLDIL
ncbi:hypothetical protein MMC10_007003 [Thelotrema lepadinum]|nr:hypothetical protein [Thelotrema lepadinum]